MAKKKKVLDNCCPICGQLIDIIVSGYMHFPFIDGRRYDAICFVCSEVPRVHEYVEGVGVVFVGFDPDRLHSVEEMVGDGFDKGEAVVSVRAVRRAINNGEWVVSQLGVHVFDSLFMDVLIDG